METTGFVGRNRDLAIRVPQPWPWEKEPLSQGGSFSKKPSLLRRLFKKPYTIASFETGEPYLTRYYIWPFWEYKRKWPVHIKIHHIHTDDPGRDLHDHPWDFTSYILHGGYVEETLTNGVDLRAGISRKHYGHTWKPWRRWIRHKAQDFHRLTHLAGTWTLVFTGRRFREWGFLTENGWVHYDEYEKLCSPK